MDAPRCYLPQPGTRAGVYGRVARQAVGGCHHGGDRMSRSTVRTVSSAPITATAVVPV